MAHDEIARYAVGKVSDNAYAVLLVVIGAAVAVYAAHMNSKDLLAFGSTVAGYGAALFRHRGADEKTS